MENEDNLIKAFEEKGSKEVQDFYLKFQVELGPAFSDKEISNADLVTLLESEVLKYKSGMLSNLLNHILSELKRVKISEGDKGKETSVKAFAGEFFQCGSCGRNKHIYCYYDPYTGIRDCTCTGC
ncbi:MAG: hypothetical protein K0R51_1093 [Cytophagaceae bacterium]|jgi:hypothetical protein|nr:hypothetical protein [Cytophagaceae bacterium]